MSEPAQRLRSPRPETQASASSLRLPDGATGIITIDLPQIAENWRSLVHLVGPAECAAVVKAGAYGLGSAHIIPVLASAGCRTFFIATPSEAEEARAKAPNASIYGLDGLPEGAEKAFLRLGVRPVLSTLDAAARWAGYARGRSEPSPAALHIDTGLNRLGLTARDARRLAADDALRRALDIRLVMSHLACADNPADNKNRDQLLAFETLSALFPGVPRSLAASDGLMLGKAFHFDLVRPGYALYGGQASQSNPAPVGPAITVMARILAVNDVAPGESVGYSAVWRAKRPSRIATIAAGYADGIPRSASAANGEVRGNVLIAGHRAPVVGRVSMDLITVDVTDVPPAAIEHQTLATLIGPGLTVEDAGYSAGTIGYEILTRLGPRFARLYRPLAVAGHAGL